jgi:hypothetical protein
MRDIYSFHLSKKAKGKNGQTPESHYPVSTAFLFLPFALHRAPSAANKMGQLSTPDL